MHFVLAMTFLVEILITDHVPSSQSLSLFSLSLFHESRFEDHFTNHTPRSSPCTFTVYKHSSEKSCHTGGRPQFGP